MSRFWTIALAIALAAGLAHAQQSTQAASAPIPYRQWAAKRITPPRLIASNAAEQQYPDDARIEHMGGICAVSFVIDTQGKPQNPRIVHCSDPAFVASSLDAAKHDRFAPATTPDGKAVAVEVQGVFPYSSIDSLPHLRRFSLDRSPGKSTILREIRQPIGYGFLPVPDGVSPNPDSDGVYWFTRNVSGPRLIRFTDKGYARLAFVHEGNSVCNVLLTIDTKGRASDPKVTRCDRPELEKPVLQSLLKSRYEPGYVRGKKVEMRALMRLDYDGLSSRP
ncbi:MAG: energy transducer TonB [Terracidiphilus sp.]